MLVVLIQYVLPDDVDSAELRHGQDVLVSGDPDKPTLRGQISTVHKDGDVVSIFIPDGQDGAADFQNWVVSDGGVGVDLDPSSLLG